MLSGNGHWFYLFAYPLSGWFPTNRAEQSDEQVGFGKYLLEFFIIVKCCREMSLKYSFDSERGSMRFWDTSREKRTAIG